MKILIQAGHKGRTSGATGAPGEQKWTSEIVPKIASKLREHGFEVREVGADPSNEEIAGDWSLFLSVHYDADVYGDRGGFVDIPDPSVDFAHDESARIADHIKQTYFPTTGIPQHPDRSNRNTKFYYMWKRLSKKTPCVILEAGVGWRTPEDHQTLHFQQDKVVKGITDGIINALKPADPVDPPSEPADGQAFLDHVGVKDFDEAIRVWDQEQQFLEDERKKNKELQRQIDEHECPITPEPEPIKGFEAVTSENFDENGNLIGLKKVVRPIK